MKNRITISDFNQYREQINEMMAKAQEDFAFHKDDKKYHSSYTDICIELQNTLLSYDLSNIPYEAWDDFTIFSDVVHRADFSKTKANIDFSIVHYYGNGDFHGCQVCHLEEIKKIIKRQDFDERTIQNNPLLFLSNNFTDDFQKKFNNNMISMEDLDSLTDKQIEKKKEKEIYKHLEKRITSSILYQIIGIDKLLELYRYGENEFVVIMDLMYTLPNYQNDTILQQEFEKKLQSAKVSEIKDICYDYIKENILTGKPAIVYCRRYPIQFLQENQALFLQNDNLPEEVQDRYFRRQLTIKDYVEYPNFHKIPIDSFMKSNDFFIKFIHEHYGFSKFQELVDRHYDVFSYLAKNDQINKFCNYLQEKDDLEENFYQAVKYYFLKNIFNKDKNTIIPEWLGSMNFKEMDHINSIDDLMDYNRNTLLLDEIQFDTIELMNIDNIQRLERDNQFFSNNNVDISMFQLLSNYLHECKNPKIDFRYGKLNYQDFLIEIKKCISMMKKEDYFSLISSNQEDLWKTIFLSTTDTIDNLNYVMS